MWVLELHFSSGSWVIVMYLTSQVCSVSLRPLSSSFHLLWISWNHFSHHLSLSNSVVWSWIETFLLVYNPGSHHPEGWRWGGDPSAEFTWTTQPLAANKHYFLCWFHLALLWNDDSAPVVTLLREPGSLLPHNHLVHAAKCALRTASSKTRFSY